jgi:hypothetical protein
MTRNPSGLDIFNPAHAGPTYARRIRDPARHSTHYSRNNNISTAVFAGDEEKLRPVPRKLHMGLDGALARLRNLAPASAKT